MLLLQELRQLLRAKVLGLDEASTRTTLNLRDITIDVLSGLALLPLRGDPRVLVTAIVYGTTKSSSQYGLVRGHYLYLGVGKMALPCRHIGLFQPQSGGLPNQLLT